MSAWIIYVAAVMYRMNFLQNKILRRHTFENKLRNITVRGQSFVYWYLSGKDFVSNIFPKEDKTANVTLVFIGGASDNDPIMFWTFYEIKGLKDIISLNEGAVKKWSCSNSIFPAHLYFSKHTGKK